MGSGMYGWWGWFCWIVVLGALALLVILAGRSGRAAPPAEKPLDIAARRYAAGEISREEFLEIKKALSGG
ncbi:MAG: SHOCT domain-containing protein [Proteobacteria bacterium]|nr:SHOCT domain-containing protein [Pseudomonadota bacterium]